MISIDLKHCSRELLKVMAKESISAGNLKQLLAYDEAGVHEEVAANENTDSDTLRYLYEKYKSSDRVVRKLSKNQSTPQYILREIAFNCTENIALNLIENYALASEDITVIVRRYSSCKTICRLSIEHPRTSAITLIIIGTMHPEMLPRILATGKVKLTES